MGELLIGCVLLSGRADYIKYMCVLRREGGRGEGERGERGYL